MIIRQLSIFSDKLTKKLPENLFLEHIIKLITINKKFKYMQTIIASELKNLLEKGEALLIDVREVEEYETEHIAGSILLPLNEISIEKLPLKSKPIVLYCRSGKRSASAGQKLLEQDPNLEVFSLEGGIIAWRTEELPTKSVGRKRLPMEQQMRLLLGALLLIAFIGGIVHPFFHFLVLLIGLGQIFAGLTNHCGGTYLLSKMPWNK